MIGQADDLRGEVPIAFVELREGQSVAEAELAQAMSRASGGVQNTATDPDSQPICRGELLARS